jgi:hypothetical protein
MLCVAHGCSGIESDFAKRANRMYALFMFLVAHFAVIEAKSDQPHVLLVGMRVLMLRPGLTEKQTNHLLGLHYGPDDFVDFTISHSHCVFHLRPNYILTLDYDRSEKREIEHVLSRISIRKGD